MASCGLAAGEEKVTAEVRAAVLDKPRCGVVTVVGAGGPGVFGREPVSDGEDGEVEVVGLVLQIWVLAGSV